MFAGSLLPERTDSCHSRPLLVLSKRFPGYPSSSSVFWKLKLAKRWHSVDWLVLKYPLGGSNTILFMTCCKPENAFNQMNRSCRNTGIIYALQFLFLVFASSSLGYSEWIVAIYQDLVLFMVSLSFSLRISIIQGKGKAAFFPPTLFWKIIFWGLLKRARTQETPSQTAGVVCFHIAVLYKENPVGSVIAGYLWNIHRILSYGCIPDLEILLGD